MEERGCRVGHFMVRVQRPDLGQNLRRLGARDGRIAVDKASHMQDVLDVTERRVWLTEFSSSFVAEGQRDHDSTDGQGADNLFVHQLRIPVVEILAHMGWDQVWLVCRKGSQRRCHDHHRWGFRSKRMAGSVRSLVTLSLAGNSLRERCNELVHIGWHNHRLDNLMLEVHPLLFRR